MNLSVQVEHYMTLGEPCWQWSVVRKESREVVVAGWNIKSHEEAKAIAKAVKGILLQNSAAITSIKDT